MGGIAGNWPSKAQRTTKQMKRIRMMVPATVLLAGLMSSPADAGWGVHRGGYGASSGGASSGYASYSVGSYGSSGGSYGSSGGSYGSSGGSYGSSGGCSGGPGLLSRIHTAVHSHIAAKRARHIARRSHGSSGYSSHGSSGYSSYSSSGYASYNSSGQASYRRSYASHGSSGSSGSSGTVRYSVPSYSSNGSSGYASSGYSSSSYGYAVPQVQYESQSVGTPVYGDYSEGTVIESHPQGTVIESGDAAPAADAAPAPAPAKEAVKEAVPAEARIQQDAALITLAVAADARVTVNGHLTSSEGPIRQFMSRGLKEGFTYTYDIVVETVVDGAPQQQTQTLSLRAGDTERLVFSAPVSDKVETALVVLVPEDAQVVLAGNSTKATGEERVYRTKQLTKGQVWEGYEVTATIVRDGREVTQTQVLRLEAGSERKLVFDFDNEADLTLASR